MAVKFLVNSKLTHSIYLLRLAEWLSEEWPQALGRLLHFLWWVVDNAPDGNLDDFGVADFSEALGYRTISDAHATALIHSGFVVKSRDGHLSVLDWNEWRLDLYKVQTKRLTGEQWHQMRTEVFLRDNFTCRYCGQRTADLHCDHLVPVSRGGANDLANLVTACPECNLAKSAMTIEEWSQRGRM
jgi:HNH endonuclease